MDKELLLEKIKRNIMVHGKIIKCMDLVNLLKLILDTMKDIGLIIKDKGKEYLSGMIKINMKDNGIIIKDQVQEHLNQKMVHIKENGKMTKDVDKDK